MDNQVKTIAFKVSPRLTEILGENYRSTEAAVKELVDNAWDADATEVRISLPAVMTEDPIIIADDGAGMKTQELELEYFNVARDRRQTKGDKTARFNRKAKGRKGIGKFAGLMIADGMSVETTAAGVLTKLSFKRSELLKHQGDLENFPIETKTQAAESAASGTVITLSHLHGNMLFPNPDKLRAILVREYAREEGFRIFVNDAPITFMDIPGPKFTHTKTLPSGGIAKINITIADGKRKVPDAGLVVRVNGKTCGPASFFGLDRDEILPQKLIERAIGEIEIETNDEGLVTADWGGLAHEPKILWEGEVDAADYFSLISLLHRGLDKAVKTGL